jgi:glycerophosphoryl diester phosphodiesterase
VTPVASAAAGALRLAHRGDWRFGTENTLPAFRAALRNPACDGLELDVRGARDGTPVLLHDETLARTHGIAAAPAELSLRELGRLGVPTLAAVLDLAGPDVFLDIELKGPPLDAAPVVIGAARGTPDGTLRRAVVSSFEPETLAWLASIRPRWPRWLNAEDLEPATVALAGALGCRGISVDWHAIDERTARRVAAVGLELAAWTVRRVATAARLDRLGLVAICAEAAALDAGPSSAAGSTLAPARRQTGGPAGRPADRDLAG